MKKEEEKPSRSSDPALSRRAIDKDDEEDLDELGGRLSEEEDLEEEVLGSKPYNPFEVRLPTPERAEENHLRYSGRCWTLLPRESHG